MGYTHGKKWSEELIIEEILGIVKFYGMDTFPTHSEIYAHTNSRGLSVAVSKYGGTKYFAQKLNLKTKDCDSKFGEIYEENAMEEIRNRLGYDCKHTRPRYPYDILVNKNIKIDVKVSRQVFTNCHSWQNSFNLEKKEPTCDIFILYCLNGNGEHIKTLIIPSCSVSGRKQIGVGNVSKYDDYKDRWDIITKYNSFYNEFETI